MIIWQPKKHLFLACLAIGAASQFSSAWAVTANNLAELRSLGAGGLSNTTISLSPTGGDPHPETGIVTPGEYWINGDHIADPTSTHPRFLVLAGSGNTYDFSGTTLRLDTRKLDGYGRNLGHDSGVDVVRIDGSDNLVQGLTLIGEDIALDTDPNAQRYADWSTVFVELSGDRNTVDGAHVVARGSRTDTYGLSDAFGKGASQGMEPFIGHRKASNFRVGEATDAVVNDIHLETYSFGHNFFVQGSTNTTITNSTIKAELFSSQLVVDRPEYQEHGHTWWGEPIPNDIMLAGSEGGVRVYGGSSGLTVDNVVVDGARTGFATVHDGGNVVINNSFAYNTTSGFDVGDNTTITGSGGNIVNGPLLVFYGSGNNTTIDLELTEGTPIGTNWSAAYFNGNADISISSELAAEDLPEESYIRLGQSYFENWRDFDYNSASPEDGNPTPFTNRTFTNNTNQILVIGENATGNTGTSQGPVISNGKANFYDGITLVPSGSRTTLVSTAGLGNNGSASDGSLESNASIVEAGGTLELSPGISITDEKLSISGDGVDGLGALYTEGTVNNSTRFGSSNGSDESTIVLAGNASIGVGNLGNQLLVGEIQGTGNLVKLGAGKLSIEKATTYFGDLIVAEGQVTARSGVANHRIFVAAGASLSSIGSYAVNTLADAYLDGTLDLNARTDGTSLSGQLGKLHGTGDVISSNPFTTAGGILEIAGDLGVADFSGSIAANVSIVKSGGNTQIFSGIMSHTGTTSVTAGTLQVDGTHVGGNSYTVMGGTLSGNGSIDADIIVGAGGTLAPGASAGQLTVEQIDFEAGALFAIEIGGLIGGAEYDQLLADSATLAGDMVVSLLDVGGDSFLPDAADTFAILDAAILTGTFDNVENGARLTTAGGEGTFLVTYDNVSGMVRLSDFALSITNGDYDADGDVDGSDLLEWQRADGTSHGLTNWLNSFGSDETAGPLRVVPEPSAGCYAVLVILTTGMRMTELRFRGVTRRAQR